MTAKVKAIPEGYHTVTPYLMLQGAAQALDFYKRAFGAKEIMRSDGPQGKVMHAEITIGDSRIMLSDEIGNGACRAPQTLGGTTSSLFVYVEDVDTVFNQAISAGGKAVMTPSIQPWGDRFGSPEEIDRRMKEMMAKAAAQRAQSAAS